MKRALYRKYRPNTFSEVVGQDSITTILRREMEKKTLSHAYLFVGSRGTGKTTCAKLIAKTVNCLNPIDGNPCNVCENCRAADLGSMTDISEIDAASNNGVDDIRTLIEETAFTPTTGKYRVFIIDEVHMLSTSAFNALLKTLEEPPEHVIFILATTEVNKVLPTIISRCQRFDFKRIESDVIATRLKDVSKKENIDLKDDAASLIASLSDGGMRDALSMLDICASNDNIVTYETVAKSVGMVGRNHLFDLSESIIKKDSKALIEKIDELSKNGIDYPELTRQLAGHFRDLMITQVAGVDILDISPIDKAKLIEQAKEIDNREVTKIISFLQESFAKVSASPSKRLELELALIILCQDKVKENIITTPSVVKTETKVEERTETKKVEKVEEPIKVQAPTSIGELNSWPAVLSVLKKINPATASLFMHTKGYFDGKYVLIDIDNQTALDSLRNSDLTKKYIRRAISQVLGNEYPIGPYRGQKIAEPKAPLDRLDELIKNLPENEKIKII